MASWQGLKFWNLTLLDDLDFDAQEIRQLIDEDMQALDEQKKGESE